MQANPRVAATLVLAFKWWHTSMQILRLLDILRMQEKLCQAGEPAAGLSILRIYKRRGHKFVLHSWSSVAGRCPPSWPSAFPSLERRFLS